MREIFIQRFDEEIREIEDFPGYWASNLGRIISAPKLTQTKWIVLSPSIQVSGHLKVGLHRDRNTYNKRVHDLVGRAFNDFSGPGTQWRHLDSNPANNRADNLKWGTRLEDNWDWICDRGNQEDWGISYSPKSSKKNPFRLNMTPIPGEGEKNIGNFPTIESARRERDRLCILHRMYYRVTVKWPAKSWQSGRSWL